MYNLDELNNKTLKWSEDRGILKNGKAVTQCLKLMSELGELADNLAKGKDIKDDIGDMIVVLTNIADLTGTTIKESWNVAYEDIKDRKGFLNEQGNFIKSTDDNYEELLAEFEGGKVEAPKCVNVEPINSFEHRFMFDDGTAEVIEVKEIFKAENPQGPIGMTKRFIMESN